MNTTIVRSTLRWTVGRRSLGTVQGTRSNLPKSPQPTMPKGSLDPNYLAQLRIEENIGNLSGIEAVQALPFRIKAQNYVTAVLLAGFCGGVFYYSMSSVGTAGTKEEPLSHLMQEANEASVKKEKKAERDEESMQHVDLGVSDKDLEGGIEMAVAAEDDIANREETANRAALKPKVATERSMLNKFVFFWK
jgi:hypothetical protein